MNFHLTYDEVADVLYILLDVNAECEYVKHMGILPPRARSNKIEPGRGHIEVDFDATSRPIQFAITNAKAIYGDALRQIDVLNPAL